MKKIPSFIALCLCATLVNGQSVEITLQQCYRMAVKNHPLSSQNALFEESGKVQQTIYDLGNLPQLSANAQATYQSAVTELPIKIPNITVPEIHRDQFKVTLDAMQVIYNGGTTGKQKLVEQKNLEIDMQGTEAEIYRLRERVSQVYFGILLTGYTSEVLNLNLAELKDRLKKTESGVTNGAVLPYNQSLLRAEILNVEQKRTEIQAQKSSLIDVMEILTDTLIPDGSVFSEPALSVQPDQYINLRPEYRLFGLQQEKISTLKELTGTRHNPRVFAFADAGYGRPGLNMFKEKAELFYIVGAKASWNIWNWHQTSREIQLLDISSNILENQKKAFDLNTRAAVSQFTNDIARSEALLKTDDEIIQLRTEVTAASSSQLENGVITATEYLNVYNAEIQARLLKNLHQIQLLQAKSGYLAATGSL